MYSWAGYSFVAGIRRATRYHNDNDIGAAPHPIIAGSAECPSANCAQIQDATLRQDLDNWYHSSHGYFVELPAGAMVLLTQPDVTGDGLPEPVMVEYAVGSGKVIASMVTAEQRYSSNKIRSLKLLANELAYAISISPEVEPPILSSRELLEALVAEVEAQSLAGILGAGKRQQFDSQTDGGDEQSGIEPYEGSGQPDSLIHPGAAGAGAFGPAGRGGGRSAHFGGLGNRRGPAGRLERWENARLTSDRGGRCSSC